MSREEARLLIRSELKRVGISDKITRYVPDVSYVHVHTLHNRTTKPYVPVTHLYINRAEPYGTGRNRPSPA